jgi:hypothetical protein
MKGTIITCLRELVTSRKGPDALIDLAVGLARGMGAYFNESITVTKLSATV